jgi:translocator protein
MTKYFRIGALQLLNIVFFVLVIVVNGLADFLPINGQTTGEISNQYPNEFVPASITFSIWAVIYSMLFLFCLFQGSTLFETARRSISKRERFVERIGYLFVYSCVFNCCWILAWHYQQLLLSVIIMLGLLLTLTLIFVRLHAAGAQSDAKARWFVYMPFSVYLGWISVATIANITAWLVGQGWNGFGLDGSTWAIIMIIAAGLLAVLMLAKKDNVFYSLTIVWALAGIAIRQNALADRLNSVTLAALCTAGIILLLSLLQILRKRALHQPES